MYTEVSFGEWVSCDDVVMEEPSETGSDYNPNGDSDHEKEEQSVKKKRIVKIGGFIILAQESKLPGVTRIAMSNSSNTMPTGCNKIYKTIRVSDKKKTRRDICNILKSRRFGSLGCMFQGDPDELIGIINKARVKMH